MIDYALIARAGYERALAGLKPDNESDECRSGRLAYVAGWMRGDRERRAGLIEDDARMRAFLQGGW